MRGAFGDRAPGTAVDDLSPDRQDGQQRCMMCSLRIGVEPYAYLRVAS